MATSELLNIANIDLVMDSLLIPKGGAQVSAKSADLSLSASSSYLLNITSEEITELDIILQFSEQEKLDFYNEVEDQNLGNTFTLLDGTPIKFPHNINSGTNQIIINILNAPNSSLPPGKYPDKPNTRYNKFKISEHGNCNISVSAFLIQTPLRFPRN